MQYVGPLFVPLNTTYNHMLQPTADFIIGSDLEVHSINCLYREHSCNHEGACFRVTSRGILVRLLQTMSGSFKNA